MSSLARKFSLAIKRMNPDETVSVEVMEYALLIILNALFTIVVSLLIGGLLHQFRATLLFIVCFSMLRICSGGVHLKSATACNIVTTLLYVSAPALSLQGYSILILNALSLVFIAFWAPSPDKNSQLPRHLYPFLKMVSLLLVGSNFWFHSSVIALAFFIQSLTIIPWKRRFVS